MSSGRHFIRDHPPRSVVKDPEMKDGPVKGAIKRVALIRYRIDLWVARAIRRRTRPPRYRLAGECNGCGACCETPMIQTNAAFFRLRTTRWLILTWHRVVNGFEHIRDEPKSRAFVFRCTHFDPVTKHCDSYDSRPGMCRDYPTNLLEAGYPQFPGECSHYAIDNNAERFNAALEKLNLPPEKLEALKTRLHTKE